MTIITKLNMAKKNANKAIITLLAASAMLAAAPEAHETKTEPEKASVSKEQVADTQAQKQKMFKAAVKAKLPNKEIAKYMNFPEFIHVTKDGEFDEVAAENFFDATVKEKEEDTKFLNLCKSIKFNICYANTSTPNSFYFHLKVPCTKLTKIFEKGNPEMQQLLPKTMEIFMQPHGKGVFQAVAKEIKKQAAWEKDHMLSHFLFLSGSFFSFCFLITSAACFSKVKNKAIEKLNECNKTETVPEEKNIKELKKKYNGLLGTLLVMMSFCSTSAGICFLFEGNTIVLNTDPSVLKPFYVWFEKSMHQAYIEQEVSKEQQLQLKVAHKDASQQFQLLLKENKQLQKE